MMFEETRYRVLKLAAEQGQKADDGDLPTLSSLHGIAPDIIGDQLSEEYVRDCRNGWKQFAEAPPTEAVQQRKKQHASDCAVHNGPALPAGPCDCGFDSMPA